MGMTSSCQCKPLLLPHFKTPRCPSLAAPRSIQESYGQPLLASHSRVSTRPFSAAACVVHRLKGTGGSWLLNHSSASILPCSAAVAHTLSSKGHPRPRSHWSVSTWPPSAAAAANSCESVAPLRLRTSRPPGLLAARMATASWTPSSRSSLPQTHRCSQSRKLAEKVTEVMDSRGPRSVCAAPSISLAIRRSCLETMATLCSG
mmetsp:Transcript_495/g.1962  ORF Transcript_495/g.1962 Transcript_495/m.1962 type:complete len:203 (-) Transcript_495:1264-1872(-)